MVREQEFGTWVADADLLSSTVAVAIQEHPGIDQRVASVEHGTFLNGVSGRACSATTR